MNQKRRLSTFDLVKGICMLSVVGCHFDESLFRKINFTFNLPAFFLIGGYFYSVNSGRLKGRSIRLLKPYLFTVLLIAAVDTMKVGDVSQPFTMINKRGKTVCCIARLKSRTDGHKATITDDFQVLKDVVLDKRRNDAIHDWVVKKIKSVYVRLNDEYRDCDFEYQGWVR